MATESFLEFGMSVDANPRGELRLLLHVVKPTLYFSAGRSFFFARPLIFNSIGVPTNPNRFLN